MAYLQTFHLVTKSNSPTCYNWIIVYELNYVNLNIEQSDSVYNVITDVYISMIVSNKNIMPIQIA